ncbi:MAG: TonB-dependent receptor [Bacteroidales bacterium]|nr:TonB-dependent receptor [Bacteroidales bacterium]
MRTLFTALLLVFAGTLLHAQKSMVSGWVYDINTGESLPGVHIIYDGSRGIATDKNGKFLITFKGQSIELLFRFVGYKSETQTLIIKTGESLETEIALTPDITEINEIVVTAGKSEQRLSELTVSMNLIKPYMITRNHIVNASEIINMTPGIEIMDGQASIRGGSGYSYGAGSRIMALVNGLPMLSTDAGNIKWGTLPVENLSQIEVIKGASSVLYGSSALNGVINFITGDAGDVPVTRFSIVTGIYDKPKNKDWVWWDTPRMVESLSFSHSKRYGNTDIEIGSRLINDNGYRRLNDERIGRVNFRIKHNSAKYKSLSYGLGVNGSYTLKNDFLLWEDALYGALKQSEATAMDYKGVSFSIDPFISISGSNNLKHEFKARYLANLNRMPENPNNNSNSYSLFTEYQYTRSLSEIINIVAGVSQQYSIINSEFYGDHTGFNIAAYSQFEIKPTEKLKGVAGVRLEESFLDGDADRLVPIFRTGVNYRIASSSFMRFSFGQGYRYPSVAEKYAYTTVGSIIIFPNPEIRSESGWSSEIGLKRGISTEKVSGYTDISLFYSQNKDLIEYVFGIYPDPVTGEFGYGFRPVNIQNSRVYGAEVEFMLNRNIGRLNTTLRGGYTYMYPVEYNAVTNKNTGDYLKFRRKHSAKISLSTIYRKMEFGMNIYIQSKILEIDDVFVNPLTRETILPGFYDYWTENQSGHFVMDFQTGYRLNSRYSFSFSVKNLTNTEYMGRPGDIMPHRYYSLQFTGRF